MAEQPLSGRKTKKMKVIVTEFGIGMIPPDLIHKLRITAVTADEVKKSYVGGEAINSFVSAEMVKIIQASLNEGDESIFIPIQANPQTIRLSADDIAFVGHCEPRLEVGAAEPTVSWFKAHFPKPKNRLVTGVVNEFNFAAAYAAAVEQLHDGETPHSVNFTDRGADGMGEQLICTITINY